MASQMGYFERLKKALFSSEELFKEIAKEKSILPSFKFFIFTFLLIDAFILVLFLIAQQISSFSGANIFGFISISFIFQMLISSSILLVIFSFIFSAVLHLMIKLLGGKGAYLESYKAYAHSFAPLIAIIAAFIPFIGSLIILIWQLFILTTGLSYLHRISGARAFLAWFLSIILIFALLGILLGLLFSVMYLFTDFLV